MSNSNKHETLERLLGYLGQDPGNPSLLRDAAEAALAADDPAQAATLLARLEETGDFGPADRNVTAIAAMRAGDHVRAAQVFEALLADDPEDIALRFNLAWTRALLKDSSGARDLLDEVMVTALPQAAMLDVQLLHDAGEFGLAGERARQHLSRHPGYGPLLAAVSVLALDIEDEELARECAEKAGGHPDALATLGTLTLGEQDHGRARALFEQALALNERSPRAWVGLGLSSLAAGKAADAGPAIDRGAALFGYHLGSWIAAGWAYLLAGDSGLARQRFELALDLDPSFAESHGSLAVMDAMEGNRDSAQKRVEIALRLDRTCFSAAFAQTVIAAADGQQETVQRILEIALRQPLDEKGRTIGDALARLAR